MKSNVVIYFGAEIRAPYKLHIGDGSIIGENLFWMLERRHLDRG
jgi:hypothetical protein